MKSIATAFFLCLTLMSGEKLVDSHVVDKEFYPAFMYTSTFTISEQEMPVEKSMTTNVSDTYMITYEGFGIKSGIPIQRRDEVDKKTYNNTKIGDTWHE